MADEQNKAGMIVRADFGGGLDQSSDAWRVPPSQLSDLVNGRIDRVGSVRKRYGYQPLTPPLNVAGAPIGAVGTSISASVLDAARDNAIDDGVSGSSASSRILDECGYVSRRYSPNSVNGWVTEGAVSDVIADVVNFDGAAGSFDEAFDIGAAGGFVFVVRATKAKQVLGATGTTVTITLSQFDATSRTLIDAQSVNLSGPVYPKLLVCPSVGTVVVSCITPDRTSAGWPTAVAKAIITLGACTYSSSGLGTLLFGYQSGYAFDSDWYELTAYRYTTAERYRPLAPYDIAINGTKLYVVGYSTRKGKYIAQQYDITAGSLALGGETQIATTAKKGIVALSIEHDGSNTIGVVGVSLDVDLTLSPPYKSTNGEIEIVLVDASTLAKTVANIATIVKTGIPTVGSLTIARTLQSNSAPPWYQWSGFVEVLDWSNELVYSHQIHEYSIRSDTGATTSESYLSSATPTARAFRLTYFGRVASSGRLPVRLPLGVASSQSTWLGRDLATNQLETDLAANYPGNIGTAILTGPFQHRTTVCASPAATVIPRLLPTAPPRPFQIGSTWYVPHRQALDGAGGFAFGALELNQRARGDMLATTITDLPIVAGGVVQTLDGKEAAETAIIDRPYIGAVVRSGGGVAVDFTDGVYLIQAVLTYRDAGGNLHRSTPSDPYRVVVTNSASAAQNTWTIYHSLPDYLSRTDAVLELYVTEPNGTILRKWFTVPTLRTFGSLSWAATVVRDAGTLSATSLGLPDLDSPTIYTTGGVLPYVPVPSARFSFLFRNRLIVGGADDPRNVYYANPPTANEAPTFAAGNIIFLDHDSGATAAGTLNDKLVIFTASAIYLVFGQFRDATGAGDALAPPENLHNFIGCTQPQSVYANPAGLIFFGTDNRFYLLTGELELKPIGLAVQDITIDQRYNQVQAVVDIPEEREVRFYVASALTGSKMVLVYNHQFNQWSRDTVSFASGINTANWGGACQCDPLGTLVVTDQDWAQDNRSSRYDATYYVPMTVKTAWIQPGGTQDYARMRYAQILGRSAGDHTLNVKVYCDFDESTVRSTGTWTAAQLAPIAGSSWPEQVKLQIATQKTQAVKLEIYDTAPAGATNGAGPQLVGLALDVLPLGGAKRLPAARKQ